MNLFVTDAGKFAIGGSNFGTLFRVLLGDITNVCFQVICAGIVLVKKCAEKVRASVSYAASIIR